MENKTLHKYLYTNKTWSIMETKYITLTKANIDKEHTCCAFSDKKCMTGYEMKKSMAKK